jgi:hypothetical protein
MSSLSATTAYKSSAYEVSPRTIFRRTSRTVGELGPAWLERKRGHLKPSGYAVMETAWRLRVEPH